MDTAAVQGAIMKDLQTAAQAMVEGKVLDPTIAVAGRSITYSAYTLAEGVINVGRIIAP